MTKENMKNFAGLLAMRKEDVADLKRIKCEISGIEEKIARAESFGKPESYLKKLRDLKAERMLLNEKLLLKLEEESFSIEKILNKSKGKLKPLEHIIIEKLYVEGIRWNELIWILQNNPEYRQFCYEKSTYMKLHKSALEKLCEEVG